MKINTYLEQNQDKLSYHLSRISQLQAMITQEEQAVFLCLKQERALSEVQNTLLTANAPRQEDKI